MYWIAKIEVMLKGTVLDPQGAAVKNALETMGWCEVKEVRVGKYLEVELQEEDASKAGEKVEEMCRRLLSNPVIEEYRYTLQEVD